MSKDRKSSLHFRACTSASQALAHNERDSLHEPGYLLPADMRGRNLMLDTNLSAGAIIDRYEQRQAMRSRQAVAAGASAYWEGVAVLPDDLDGVLDKLAELKRVIEERTGMAVLHVSVHTDEGYVDEHGIAHHNHHAHLIVDRMGWDMSERRMRKLSRSDLQALQTYTAEVLGMARGEAGTQRRHVPHQIYRQMAEQQRRDRAGLEREIADLTAERDALQEERDRYRAERDQLRASGRAIQADYQRAKAEHQQRMAELRQAQAQVQDLRQALDDQLDHSDLLMAQAKQAQQQAQQAQAQAQQAQQQAAMLADLTRAVGGLSAHDGDIHEVTDALAELGRPSLYARLREAWDQWRRGDHLYDVCRTIMGGVQRPKDGPNRAYRPPTDAG